MRRQNVLVTGCNARLARHVAVALAQRGHWVFAALPDCFGVNVNAARNLQNVGVMKGYRLHVLEMDVVDEAAVERAVGSIVDRAGHIDAVIHASNLGALGLAESFTAEQVREVFEVNVFGVQRVNRAVLPLMRERRSGLLLHISSVLGRFAMPNLAIFDASMFAVEALAEAYRYELSAVGVDSVIVEPGTFAAELERNSLIPEDRERISEYGDNADLGERVSVYEGLGDVPTSPELHDVVHAVVELVEMPPGTRPLRTVVDPEGGESIGELNALSEDISQRFLQTMGQEDLLRLRR
jgi:NAD(P)-dependent dehydrogenase (short-subunit alcohol dehydrogenase family)